MQVATFGRRLHGKPDILEGYRLTMIAIRDEHYRNIQFTGIASDLVEGAVFTVSTKELEQADAYEVEADYRRTLVHLRSGTNAWVYEYRRR